MVAAAVVITSTTGFAAPHSAPDSPEVEITTELVDESTDIVTIDVPAEMGIESTTEMRVVDAVPESIAVTAVDDRGEALSDSFVVESFEQVTTESFIAVMRSEVTGESSVIDTTQVQQQALPAILIAVIVHGVRIFAVAAAKEAAKRFILGFSTQKWAHIMVSKHNWSRLAKTKDEIADLMAGAVANGTRTQATNHIEFTWAHRGQTIVVRTGLDGQISNGWIK
ncbi:hypothetical protein [Microbacterium sp. SA39]|uniref:hypothetical protein n=1 Tax=Microbacterium sp. SA39 TaxID=1263625 RepID=UPI001364B100|nr:hypothetical protein [Microbacterium sp. SA39]